MDSFVILCALLLDLLLGDPRWFPHPVRMIGWVIQRCESLLRRYVKTPQAEKIGGVVLVIFTISLVFFSAQFLLLLSFHLSRFFGFIISVVLAYTTLAARGLADAARAVLSKLSEGDIDAARKELSLIVGRDTENLDEREVCRAAVETVAENTSDGVIAPLFYLAIGGPALALAYKAVNTLDSMIGYKNKKYINIGWAAARLDDAANYIPARMTAIFICTAGEILRRRKSGAATYEATPRYNPNPWKIMLRDGRNHPSPNSGYPEAAMAGILGIRLGGPSTYGGQPSVKPLIGDPVRAMDKKYIEKSVWFMYCSTLLAALSAAVFRILI